MKHIYKETHHIENQIKYMKCHLSSYVFSLLVKGMGIIEQLDPTSFTNYLKKYRNTICGRHPIGVLLNVSAIQ